MHGDDKPINFAPILRNQFRERKRFNNIGKQLHLK